SSTRARPSRPSGRTPPTPWARSDRLTQSRGLGAIGSAPALQAGGWGSSPPGSTERPGGSTPGLSSFQVLLGATPAGSDDWEPHAGPGRPSGHTPARRTP